MSLSLKNFLTLLPIILVLDLVWLGLLMHSFYDAEIGSLARRSDGAMSPRWSAAIIVYLLIPAGTVLFVQPLLSGTTPYLQAFGWGAAFGLIMYGVYDFTNLAVIEKRSLKMALVDLAWGCTLCGLSAVWIRFQLGLISKQ
ncbi:DUF2177 family protein [Schlesneria sp. T3-172]|uniref:DUF2177 family protein n=1 Tax=Schlesneria sphaerica TaxID=3373610 RepID=UPI0037C6E337